MAVKVTLTKVLQVNNANIATFLTDLNTALLAFNGAGTPGEATATKQLIGAPQILWNGTVYAAFITYSEQGNVS